MFRSPPALSSRARDNRRIGPGCRGNLDSMSRSWQFVDCRYLVHEKSACAATEKLRIGPPAACLQLRLAPNSPIGESKLNLVESYATASSAARSARGAQYSRQRFDWKTYRRVAGCGWSRSTGRV